MPTQRAPPTEEQLIAAALIAKYQKKKDKKREKRARKLDARLHELERKVGKCSRDTKVIKLSIVPMSAEARMAAIKRIYKDQD